METAFDEPTEFATVQTSVEVAQIDEHLSMFNFAGSDVRVVTQDGKPWFVLKDVCDVLELKTTHVKPRLNSEDTNTIAINGSIRGNPNKTVINESGLYDVILDSRKPELGLTSACGWLILAIAMSLGLILSYVI